MKMRAIQIVVMNWLFVIKTYNLFEKKKVNVKLYKFVRIYHKLQKHKIATKLNIFLMFCIIDL